MAKSRKPKPSFDAPGGAPAAAAPWVYRSEGAAPTAAPPAPAPPSDRARASQMTVDRYAKYAAAAGLVPVPLVDLAAIGGVQVAMLRALSEQYGVPFSQERGRALITALLGGLMPSLAGHQVLKVAGPLLGILSVAGFALASTHAVGRVFIAHFESGGTLLDVDVERARTQLAAELSRP